jgi:LysR family transcriptional regulator, regulator for metE and metH
MDLEVRHLRLVMAIAEMGTVTKASTVLHLSQSAVSHALCDIESRLKTALFLRVGRRMAPTEAGEHLIRTAAEVLARLDEAEHAIRRSGAGQEGTLRLSTHCYTCYHWLPPLIEKFRSVHPGIRIEIRPDEARQPVTAVVEGRLDLALAIGPVKATTTVARHVFDETMLVVVAHDHPLAARSFVRPTDLEHETLLLHSRPEDSFVYQRVLAPAGVRPRGVETVPLTEAITELARARLGVGLLADWAAAPYLKSGTLIGVPLTRRGVQREWFAVTLKAASASAHLRSFVDLLIANPPTSHLRHGPSRGNVRAFSRHAAHRGI